MRSASCWTQLWPRTTRRCSSRSRVTIRASRRQRRGAGSTQLDTTRSQAIDLGVARAQFEHAIAILVGKPPAMLTIPASPLAGTPPSVPVALPSELVERRPDIASAERRVAAANAEIGVAKAAYFPNVSLTGSGGLESAALATLVGGASGFWSVGASVVATAFEGGRRHAAMEQAVANRDAATAAYREDVLTAFQDVEDNLAALRILAEEGTQHADAVASAEQSLSPRDDAVLQAGVTTYLEVITAQSVGAGESDHRGRHPGAADDGERAVDQSARRRMEIVLGLSGWRGAPVGRACS